MINEKELLQQAREFDEQALATIFDTYYRMLFHYIYVHIKHIETAEDLTAEVFQRLLDALQRGKGPRKHLKAWLFRVAHNLVVDEVRQREKLRQTTLDDHLHAHGTAVESQVQDMMMAEVMIDALEQLTPKQRSVVVLKFLAEMNNTEVAHALSLPETAVKSLQHRGLAALRRQLMLSGEAT